LKEQHNNHNNISNTFKLFLKHFKTSLLFKRETSNFSL